MAIQEVVALGGAVIVNGPLALALGVSAYSVTAALMHPGRFSGSARSLGSIFLAVNTCGRFDA